LLKELVSCQPQPLDQINEVFELMHKGKSIRSLIHF